MPAVTVTTMTSLPPSSSTAPLPLLLLQQTSAVLALSHAPANIYGASASAVFNSKPPPKRKSRAKAQQNAMARHLLGVGNTAFVTGDLHKAESAMLEILAHDETVVDAHSLLVFVYEEMRDAHKAFVHEKRRLELMEPSEITTERLTVCAKRAMQAGKNQEAIAIAKQALSLDHTNQKAGLILCELLIANREYRLAIETCRQLLGAGIDTHVLLMEARARVEMNDKEGALKILTQVAQSVLAPSVDQPAPLNYIERVAPEDEEDVIATGLSALSGAVDLLMSSGQWTEVRTLISRCKTFLWTGKCANPRITWSWDLLERSTSRSSYSPRAMPLDLAVKYAICGLELGLGDNAQAVCDLLGKLQLSTKDVGPYEDLHVSLASALLRAGKPKLAVSLLKRVDLVAPIRNSPSHINQFADALEQTGEISYAEEVRARLGNLMWPIASSPEADAVCVLSVQAQKPSGLEESTTSLEERFQACWNARDAEDFTFLVGTLLCQSLDLQTVQALGVLEPSSADVGQVYTCMGREKFIMLLEAFFQRISGLNLLAGIAAVSLFRACRSSEKNAVAFVVAKYLALQEYQDVPGAHLPVEFMLQQIMQGAQDALRVDQDKIKSWARPHVQRLRHLKESVDAEPLVDLFWPGQKLWQVRLERQVQDYQSDSLPMPKRLRAGMQATQLLAKHCSDSNMMTKYIETLGLSRWTNLCKKD